MRVVDQSLGKKHAPVLEEVATMAHDLDTTIRVVAVDPCKDLVMRQKLRVLLDLHALGGPSAHNRVVGLIFAGRHIGGDNVSNRFYLSKL